MSSEYYCGKCQRNHKKSSKVGKAHLQYIKIVFKRSKSHHNACLLQDNHYQLQKQRIFNVTENSDSDDEKLKKNLIEEKDASRSNYFVNLVRDYQKSYQKGIEKYGVWWKVFQLSIWSIVLIFLLTASVMFVLFLPQIDWINWTLS